jgi:hypothetical protein
MANLMAEKALLTEYGHHEDEQEFQRHYTLLDSLRRSATFGLLAVSMSMLKAALNGLTVLLLVVFLIRSRERAPSRQQCPGSDFNGFVPAGIVTLRANDTAVTTT